MKTFFNLIQEVQKKERCHKCGGCVTFCSAINYGALDLDDDGKPFYSDIEKCIECGICYMICPETHELDEEIKKKAEWSSPAGRIISTSVARAKDLIIRENGTDGGVVTAMLLHLFDTGRINGAVVSKSLDRGRVPWLATTREEIMDSAGSHFDHSQGMPAFAETYSTFSPSVKALKELRKEGIEKIAFVGTPCQINTIRKMQVLGVVPSDTIQFCFGLFCSGNYIFHGSRIRKIEDKYHFRMDDVEKINIKENFLFNLSTGEQREVPLEDMQQLKRTACSFCEDFSAEYADISFGGLGADHGWTTVITRSPLGRAVLADASEKVLEHFDYDHNPLYATQAEDRVIKASRNKLAGAQKMMDQLAKKGINVIS
ncbi:MAG: Coenzyme F420 hydrogenase/dehydrogenase, beta subunit C-terminal domain [Desulfobacteraceae bacterium]